MGDWVVWWWVGEGTLVGVTSRGVGGMRWVDEMRMSCWGMRMRTLSGRMCKSWEGRRGEGIFGERRSLDQRASLVISASRQYLLFSFVQQAGSTAVCKYHLLELHRSCNHLHESQSAHSKHSSFTLHQTFMCWRPSFLAHTILHLNAFI